MKASVLWSALTLLCTLCFALEHLRKASVVIVGAGPAGLACALMLESHGCTDITVIEKRSKASFESEKAYLYMLAPNGQPTTDYLNMTRKIADLSVSSYNFSTLKVVEPNAAVKVKKVPLRTVGKEKFWLPRSAILDCFLDKVKSVNSAARRRSKVKHINLLFDSTCGALEVDRNGKVEVTIMTGNDSKSVIEADILVGCDGVNSGQSAVLQCSITLR
jgi:2-polyprenyl-6-methoxyphenol hydroxylase-like FAD-dependent oxidoreductase